LIGNDRKVNTEVREVEKMDLDILSEDKRRPL